MKPFFLALSCLTLIQAAHAEGTIKRCLRLPEVKTQGATVYKLVNGLCFNEGCGWSTVVGLNEDATQALSSAKRGDLVVISGTENENVIFAKKVEVTGSCN